MKKDYAVEFYFGVRPVSTFTLYVTAIFLSLAVSLVSHYSKVGKRDLWALIDEIGQQYNIRVINKLIMSVPELLGDRIRRDIDKAIEEYNSMVELGEPTIPSPKWIDEEEGETPLGGALGYSYDFTETEKDDEQR